jgi:hypothetical protein
MAGSSGMQSPLLPVLDAFFGVKHDHPGIQKLLSAAHETYMPAHKWFIEEVAQRSPAMLAQLSHLGLNKYICEAISGLVAFRQAHIDTVSHYIGSSVGTGGSSGTSMLQVMLDTTQKQRDALYTPTKVMSSL